MTQEYTPVAWQDETTSQQGTLINAERLNQMQTAHHYADGFEEVDAVPTADPGVSYHKIVYCTADSTIYRWDGTEWTKDIDDETKALLQQEIARATQAESELRGQLEDEHDARVDAEAAINDRITDETTELIQRIETEASTRYAADSALGTRITNETSARETADTGLGNRITAEATARAEADTALGGRIDTEQARAEAAEQANAQAIANTYTKAEIDTALGAKADVATTYTKTEVQTYVSNALDGYLPMVRTTGNQTIGGAKTFSEFIHGALSYDRYIASGANGGKWVRVGTVSSSALSIYMRIFWRYGVAEVMGPLTDLHLHYNCSAGSGTPEVTVVQETSGAYTIWWKHTGNYIATYFCDAIANRYGGGAPDYFTPSNNDTPETAPVVESGATAYPAGVIDAPSTYVHTSGAETIAGAKSFTDPLTNFVHNGQVKDIYSSTQKIATMTTNTFIEYQGYKDGDGFRFGSDIFQKSSNAGEVTRRLFAVGKDGHEADLRICSSGFLIGPYRAYDPTHTTDVATIGTLDAYTPMVRTTGNQDIIGIKAFSMPNYGYTLAVKDTGLDITNIQAQRVHTIPFLDKNGVGIANIRYVVQTTGEVLVQLEMRKTDGTFKYVNLGDNN